MSRVRAAFIVKGVRRRAEDDFSVAVPFNYEPDPLSVRFRIAGICHIYFTDLAFAMLHELMYVPFPCDLYISTDTEEKREFLAQIFSVWRRGQVEIRLVENRGRDIAPKFVTFRDVYNKYDLILFTHSKKTSNYGPGWRVFLAQNLLGSEKIVCSIVEAFIRLPSLGMVISQHYEPIREGGWLNWMGNYRLARRLARRMAINLDPRGVVDFPSGSMLWARSVALSPLLELNLNINDFPIEKGQIDQTTAHAIERLLLYVCERAGFIWLKVAGPSMFKDRNTIESIDSPADLYAFVEKHGLHLSRPKRRQCQNA